MFCFAERMSGEKPTPYAYAPTTSGRKLPYELGNPQTISTNISMAESDLSSIAETRYHVPNLSDDDDAPALQVGALFEAHRNRRAVVAEVVARPDAVVPERRYQGAGVCHCHKCKEMPLRVEQKCCSEEKLNNTCLPDYVQGRCVLDTEDIKHCLHHVTVRHLWMEQQRYFGLTGDALLFGNMTNKNYRYHAYRSYVKYIYGLLGRYNRKVIPSCVINYIRNKWPDPEGSYIGFIDVDEHGMPIHNDEVNDVPFDDE